MSENTVLAAAEARILPAQARAQTTRTQIVESMRAEIGLEHYERAKLELPKLKTLLTQTVHPYLSRVARLAQHAPAPLPAFVLSHVRELQDTCANGANWTQEGLQEWERLAPPYAEGSTLELNLNRRAEEIGSIRMKLRNWSGREDRLRNLMCNIDNWIAEARWPGGV